MTTYNNQFSNNLDPDERIEWSDTPIQGVQFSSRDIFLVPFSLMWCGFALFWEYSVLSTGAPLFFKLWGIPFVIVGLYFVFGRFIHEAHKRKSTFYASTNKRIIIKTGKRIKSINHGKWPTIQLTEYDSGIGTILFGEEEGAAFAFKSQQWSSMPKVPCFYKIKNARSVYTKLCNT